MTKDRGNSIRYTHPEHNLNATSFCLEDKKNTDYYTILARCPAAEIVLPDHDSTT